MFRLDQRGIAAIAVVVIIAVSTGAAVATPVIVDVADVDPDSPLYGLERLGERIRMVSDEDQMKERWSEYVRLEDRGKGLAYRNILDEFVEKMKSVAPENAEAKQEIVAWMQDQMPGIGRVRLGLAKGLCLKVRDNIPEASEDIEDLLENLPEGPLADNETVENLRARLMLIAEHLREIREKYENTIGEEIRKEIEEYLGTDNLLVDVDVRVNVVIRIGPPAPVMKNFDNELEELNEKLSEVQAMLEGAPENAPGKHAAKRLVDTAIELRDNAVAAYEENKVIKALALIYVADMHLRNAKRILEHASEWEPRFENEWTGWKETWENMKQEWIKEGAWQGIVENFDQYREQVRQRWREKMQEMGVGGGYSPVVT
jgi:hypothetical protein